MAERPWWRQLNGQPPWPNPSWWDKSSVARAGFIFTVLFGGMFILRLITPTTMGGGGGWLWVYISLTFFALAVFLVGVVQAKRDQPEE